MGTQRVVLTMSLLAILLIVMAGAAPPAWAQGQMPPQAQPPPQRQAPQVTPAAPTTPWELKLALDQQPDAATGLAAPPANDDFDAALPIAILPYVATAYTVDATVAADDPAMSCGSGANSNTIWYRVQLAAAARLYIKSFGSDYDTVVAAFTGSRGALTAIACNDDFGGTTQSQIDFVAEAGVVYYLEVADYGAPGGGNLVLTVEAEALPVIDVPLDILLLQDETGSMGDDIGSLVALAPEIWNSVEGMAQAGFRMGVSGLRDYARYPWGDAGDWVYRRLQDLTAVESEFGAGVNLLTASGGYDTPEAQYAALYYALTPGHPCVDSDGGGTCTDPVDTPVGQQPSFRAGAKRVILLATDADCHEPANTSGYPGPSRDQTVLALKSANAALIGLVPGGAGYISCVDDLAAETGGSVENTGSSGQQVAEAIARAIGQFSSTPGAEGTSQLTVASQLEVTDAIRPRVIVFNPTGIIRTYQLKVYLLQGGIVRAAIERTVTVGATGSQLVSDITFGPWPQGAYTVRSELWLNDRPIDTQGPLDVRVIDPEKQKAINEAEKLRVAAYTEMNDMASMVAGRYEESLSDLILESITQLVSFLADDLLRTIGETAHIPAVKLESSISEITSFAAQILAWWQNKVEEPIHEAAHDAITTDFAPIRDGIDSRQVQYNDFVDSHSAFSWTDGMGGIVSRYVRAIRDRVEWEVIPGYNGVPPIYVGPTTLGWEDLNWTFLSWVLEYLGYILLALAILLLIVLAIKFTVVSLGLAVPLIIKSAAALISLILTKAGIAKYAGTWFLVLLTIAMHIQAVNYVAPAVQSQHGEGLDTLTSEIGVAAVGAGAVTAEVTRSGGALVVASQITNPGAAAINPLVEQSLYSPDGDVIDIALRPQAVAAGGSAQVAATFAYRLPPGAYRVVSALHDSEHVGAAATAVPFQVTAAAVTLDAALADTTLALGQPLAAAITVRNTSAVSNTGTLMLTAIASDGDHMDAWTLDLAPGEARTVDYTFVPQAAGAYRLQVGLTQDLIPLAVHDLAYVVGEGASIAINYAHAATYAPGAAVAIPLAVTNSGAAITTTVVAISILDTASTPPTPVIGKTCTVTVAPGATEVCAFTAPGAAFPGPGHYAVRTTLNGAAYRASDFYIEAVDTLFAEVYPDEIIYAAGDTVTLDISVRNATYALTDADLTVTSQGPDGVVTTAVVTQLGTGRYQAIMVAGPAGTHSVEVRLSKPDYRCIGNVAYFIVDDISVLNVAVEGRILLGATRPLTLTVYNEWGVPVVGASAVLSGTQELAAYFTDDAGQAVIYATAPVTDSYRLTVEKPGYAVTVQSVPVWIAPDVTPPFLVVDAPAATNVTPATVTGVTEPAAVVYVNGMAAPVDSGGAFSSAVPLFEGPNLVTITASDAVSNTVEMTRTIVLDTVAPALAVTSPAAGTVTRADTVEVTGQTEPGALVTVAGYAVPVSAADGTFRAWVLLAPGRNDITVRAADAAGNSSAEIRTVIRPRLLYLPLIRR